MRVSESDLISCACPLQIQLKVTVNEETGSAELDFGGTGCEIRGNLNASISVVHPAVIYCIRTMLNVDIPLNAGCLEPLTGALHPSDHPSSFHASTHRRQSHPSESSASLSFDLTFAYTSLTFSYAVKISEASPLSPSRTAAVCGGNVLTSQRIVDVVLRAFHVCAASRRTNPQHLLSQITCIDLMKIEPRANWYSDTENLIGTVTADTGLSF